MSYGDNDNHVLARVGKKIALGQALEHQPRIVAVCVPERMGARRDRTASNAESTATTSSAPSLVWCLYQFAPKLLLGLWRFAQSNLV